MAGRPRVMASVVQVAELKELARSSWREEADRACAVLLSREGWSSVDLGVALGVTADSVRHWRNWFAVGGVAALRTTLAPGPSPAKGERALSIASAILSEAVENRPNWTIPRLRAEIERRGGPAISQSRLSILLRKKGGSTGADRGTP